MPTIQLAANYITGSDLGDADPANDFAVGHLQRRCQKKPA